MTIKRKPVSKKKSTEKNKGGRPRIDMDEPAFTAWVFEYYKEEFKNVLDLFGGSGSTLIACENKGKNAFIMELSEHYVDTIINRWQTYTGKKAVLEATGQTYEELKAERDGDKA